MGSASRLFSDVSNEDLPLTRTYESTFNNKNYLRKLDRDAESEIQIQRQGPDENVPQKDGRGTILGFISDLVGSPRR